MAILRANAKAGNVRISQRVVDFADRPTSVWVIAPACSAMDLPQSAVACSCTQTYIDLRPCLEHGKPKDNEERLLMDLPV